MAIQDASEKDIARFWRHVDKNGPIPQSAPHLGPCWLWNKGLTRGFGYGKFKAQRTHISAHRASFFFTHGRMAIPQCLHSCDTPACVNPAHLREGTQKENMEEKVAKGRQPRGKHHHFVTHPERVPRGSRNGMAVLNEKLVREIRAVHDLAGISCFRIHELYGISETVAQEVVFRRSWKHVV